ncbi:MAG: hypothetical protein HN742_27155 [Lentisphaerae bacterium]|nr:hypothetical protein [Lentisphaerota bacterium]MBT4822337.1 hypothetical protein [Lentisphaerota bacterium]MBT5607859.1 hypothetical protein [Lentisphaerota bacterium]MBT7054841.1 hypothetical protein [Lentisphaerota bacterium]MBT7845581.1 hypothetical protein [Lentisphaerota bacterium]
MEQHGDVDQNLSVDALIEEATCAQVGHDADARARKRARWLGVSNGRGTQADYLPITIRANDPSDPYCSANLHSHVRYSLAEQIDSPENMLAEWLPRLRSWIQFPSDVYPGLAPRFGNAFLLSAFGLGVRIMDDTLHAERLLSRDEARNLVLPDDFAERGMVKRAAEYTRYCRSVLPEEIHTGLFFMMSPFDLAYLIRGQDLLMDMYDDPALVHQLMGECTKLFVEVTQLYKGLAGEPDDWYWYGNNVMAGGGQLCEDCCVMVSPECHAEFSIPYTKRAFDALGGGWVHFCGDGRQIVDNYLAMPGMHGILYGQMHLNGDRNGLLKQFEDAGKGLNYAVARKPGESWLDYFRRFLAPVSRKAGVWMHVGLSPNEWAVGPQLMELWHQAQDEKWPSRHE